MQSTTMDMQTLVANLPGIVYRFTYDDPLGTLFLSDNFEDLSGFSAKPFRKGERSFEALIFEDDLPYVKRKLREAIREQKPYELEYRVRCANGATCWVDDKGKPVFDEQGEVKWLDGFIMDITARKEAQQEARSNDFRFRNLVANLPGIVYRCTYDKKWDTLYMSDSFVDLCGYSVEEFRKRTRSYWEIIIKEDIPHIKKVVQAAVRKQEPYEMEYRVYHDNGSVRWVYDQGRPVFDENGLVRFLDGVMFDITQRKKMETELTQYQSQLEQLVTDRTRRLEIMALLSGQLNEIVDLDNLLDGFVQQLQTGLDYDHVQIFLLDKQTNELNLLAWAGECDTENETEAQRIKVGQGIIGTVARNSQAILCNNTRLERRFIPNPRFAAAKSELAVPLRRSTETGWQQVIGVLDVQSNRLNHFVAEDEALVQSIADQAAIAVDNARLLREMKNTVEQLKQVDRLKSEFLTTMSHELRTPLNSILGFSDLLLEELSGPLPPPVRRDVEVIHSTGQHLLAIINDVLDISKIEAGMIEIVPNPCNLLELMEDVSATARLLAKDKPVEVRSEIAESPPTVLIDQDRIKQVLFNLIENAVEFTQAGEVVIKVALYQESEQLRFMVQDTGPGIPEEKQAEIFERFSQVDMSSTREHGGTGLGLTICKQLVELHDGEIGVDSQVGQGSEFWFILPLILA